MDIRTAFLLDTEGPWGFPFQPPPAPLLWFLSSGTSREWECGRVEAGPGAEAIAPRPVLQNQEYEHPRDLAACCGSCRNVSCLFTFPNGTTSLFLVSSPQLHDWAGVPAWDTQDQLPGLGPHGALGSAKFWAAPVLRAVAYRLTGAVVPKSPSATSVPPARGVLDRTLHPPPLQQHAPGRRARPLAHQLPTTQRDRVCQGQCQPPLPTAQLEARGTGCLSGGGG